MLTDAGSVITSGLGTVWSLMTGNELITLFVGASIVSLAFAFFKKAKRAAR